MCSSCTKAGRWRSGCRDGRGPSVTPSPPRELPQYRQPQVVSQQYQPQPQAVAGPSRASSVYPGSTFAVTPTTTRPSSASTASDHSIHSAEQTLNLICSNHSINSLTQRLSQETRTANALKNELDAWAKQIDPHAYTTRKPWHQGMQTAYNRYKQLAENVGTSHKALRTYRNATAKNTTPEQYIERAKLAIEWGTAATKAAQARLDFQVTYRDAYPFANINSHIDEAGTTLTNARKAVDAARKEYNSIWAAAGPADPTVLQ